LVSFKVELKMNSTASRQGLKTRSYVDNSVLSSGNWYKIAVQNSGVHKITFTDLQNMGIDPGSINPRNLRIYGNGGGMLPESLTGLYYDDLQENAIIVVGESDGSFDAQDYILFYGESPHEWKYNAGSQHFDHKYNIYTEHTYYYIATHLGTGKRISNQSQSSQTETHTVNTFIDYAFHDLDQRNLANTGRVWYGEVFDITTSRDFSFSFPNINASQQVYFKAYVAANSQSSSDFIFYYDDNQILKGTISGIPPSNTDTYARKYIGNSNFTPSGSELTIRVDYIKREPGAQGHLNYLALNASRQLRFTEGQMAFREPSSIGTNNVTNFRLSNAGSNVAIWNISDPLNISTILATQNGQQKSFKLATDTLLEFIAYDGNTFFNIEFIEKVQNQNLHGVNNMDMVIISHPDFLAEAERLADHHRNNDNLSIYITEPQKIYNEFSSGAQDISAIRNFMRMLYDRSSAENMPKYLLMFGDASFDYKDRIDNNSNFVPTWEDEESLTTVYSIATDDFFGFLDESADADNLLDLGIGRFVVETIEQAREAVDKVLYYAANSAEVQGDWRNFICFVADDEDSNLHLNQAEDMANNMDTTHKHLNIDKIYVDAFPQISTPGGQRAPEVNIAINNRMAKGTFIMNYTGHGGEVGWAHERILEIADINSWTNYDMLSIFITATCEFSRYDDPERVSAGELVFRNANGGAIGMFTTARATFGGSNFNLNKAMYDVMFEKINGEYPRFGDLIRLAKNNGGVGDNDQKFILLGDPALTMAYPEHSIVTTTINETPVASEADTIQALSKVKVTGEIRNSAGSLLNNYQGIVYPIVYDKPTMVTTLGTDPKSIPKTFELQNSILYKGKAQVINGMFNFTFIVPKDIGYQYGFGKISYYSDSDDTDATGFYDNLIIGGLDQNVEPDEIGPEVRLYMNEEDFAFGGMTNENPYILAFVNDQSGINTVGSGIGHDIVATLDENTDKPIVLNEYYEADLDSYKSGTIRYGLQGVEKGRHTLSLKVWDVYNNSNTAYTEFVVSETAELAIDRIYNYPNPFTTNTSFYFEHNQPGITLEVLVQIFTVSGRLVKTIDATMQTSGFRSDAIPWDGLDDYGDRIGKGVYIYQLRVRNMEGEYADKLEKLVILK